MRVDLGTGRDSCPTVPGWIRRRADARSWPSVTEARRTSWDLGGVPSNVHAAVRADGPWQGRLPEWPKGADCKSAAQATGVRISHLPLLGNGPASSTEVAGPSRLRGGTGAVVVGARRKVRRNDPPEYIWVPKWLRTAQEVTLCSREGEHACGDFHGAGADLTVRRLPPVARRDRERRLRAEPIAPDLSQSAGLCRGRGCERSDRGRALVLRNSVQHHSRFRYRAAGRRERTRSGIHRQRDVPAAGGMEAGNLPGQPVRTARRVRIAGAARLGRRRFPLRRGADRLSRPQGYRQFDPAQSFPGSGGIGGGRRHRSHPALWLGPGSCQPDPWRRARRSGGRTVFDAGGQGDVLAGRHSRTAGSDDRQMPRRGRYVRNLRTGGLLAVFVVGTTPRLSALRRARRRGRCALPDLLEVPSPAHGPHPDVFVRAQGHGGQLRPCRLAGTDRADPRSAQCQSCPRPSQRTGQRLPDHRRRPGRRSRGAGPGTGRPAAPSCSVGRTSPGLPATKPRTGRCCEPWKLAGRGT